MADIAFSMSFDERSLSEIAQFYGFSIYLSEEVQAALDSMQSPLVDSIRGSMHWMHPTGALEESIHGIRSSPYELQAGSDLPYAHRRNFSFKGPDSLGRMFPNDPAAHFMEQGMDAEQSAILASVEEAAQRAMTRLGAV